MRSVDLTPFGFTPTESSAYAALLARGPLSGYAVAKALSIARANAYQALDGLVTKRVASPTGERPQRYRPLPPTALLAMIVERQSAQLDRLQEQLHSRPETAHPAVVALTSRRALEELALRTAARAPGKLICVGPTAFLEALAPAWHKRQADALPTALWVVGEPGATRLALAGSVDPGALEGYFGRDPFLMSTEQAGVIAARLESQSASGYWSNDPVLAGSLRAALHSLLAS